jgi:hypothetical protein
MRAGAGDVLLPKNSGSCPKSTTFGSLIRQSQVRERRRKPTSVADELEWLIGRYQPEMGWMADDVFELKRRGLKLPFECISRAGPTV